KVIYHPHRYENNDLLFEDDKLEARAIVLNHRIPCCGFVFKEKQQSGNISKEIITKHKLTIDQIVSIKNGGDLLTSEGILICNEELVSAKAPPRKYAYCSDTSYDEGLIPFIDGANLLYHEA